MSIKIGMQKTRIQPKYAIFLSSIQVVFYYDDQFWINKIVSRHFPKMTSFRLPEKAFML